ncbi:MAG: ATP-binding protein [Candidatus Saccharimonadales bacterium]
MYNGGHQLNNRTIQVIRVAGFVVPVILLIYGIMIQFGVIDTIKQVDSSTLYAIMIPWIGVALYQLLYNKNYPIWSGLQLVIYHCLAIIYVLFISGFMAPIVIAWVLLMLGSYSFFSRPGVYLSVLGLSLAAVLDSVVNFGDTNIAISNTVAAVTLLIVGLTAVTLGRSQESDSEALARSRAQEALQRDRMLTIVNNLADAVLSTDEAGVVRVYNASSLSLLDTNASLVGRHINDILELTDSEDESVDLYVQLRRSTSATTRDDLCMTIGDDTLRLEVTYTPIRSSFSTSKQSESEDGYIIIMRDITAAKSLEEERDEFISVVSHELRTPITIAEGTISNVMLMRERGDVADRILTDAIANAHDQVVYLSKMVNDLSTLSRAERGIADDHESIKVKQLCTDLFNEYEPEAKKHDLHFDLDIGNRLGSVSASPLYLKELLQNFITNSIKYTKEGRVTLHARRTNDIVTFSVSDTGIGMSKSDQTKIFKKFYRSEDYRTRETGGTGLGLYVAVKLARKMNTQIELESRLNHGSTFSFDMHAEPFAKK